MLNKKTKQFIVSNRDVISSQAIGFAVTAAVGLVASASKIIFNSHDYEYKRIVEFKPKKGYMITEDLSTVNTLRDKLHPENYEEFED